MSGYLDSIEEWEKYQKEIFDWQKDIEIAFNNTIINVLKRAYPYIIDIAEFEFPHFFYKISFLQLKVILFMKPEYINQNHERLNKDINGLLRMMMLDKREIETTKETLSLEVRVFAVASE